MLYEVITNNRTILLPAAGGGVGGVQDGDTFRIDLIASVSFFIMFYFLHNQWANHALWASFIVYLILRGVMQSFFGKSIFRVTITRNID